MLLFTINELDLFSPLPLKHPPVTTVCFHILTAGSQTLQGPAAKNQLGIITALHEHCAAVPGPFAMQMCRDTFWPF